MEDKKDKYANRVVVDEEYLQNVAEMCSVPGKSFKQVSLDMGKAESYVHNLRNKFPELVEMTDNRIRERFKEMSNSATNKLYELMEGAANENVQLNAAKEILSKAGYDAVQKVENTNKEIVVELFSDED